METAPFDGGRIMLRNTNHLVGHLEGCDGLKTGFTMQAGFNLTATARRNDLLCRRTNGDENSRTC